MWRRYCVMYIRLNKQSVTFHAVIGSTEVIHSGPCHDSESRVPYVSNVLPYGIFFNQLLLIAEWFKNESFCTVSAVQFSFLIRFCVFFVGVPQPTDFTADIVFMMDASSSVSQNDYRTEKDFVKALAKLLNVAPGKSRASLVTYSNNPSVIFRLNGYRNSLDFEQQVDRAPLLGGSRRMDKALETAGTILNEARRSAPKIAVLLTTGRQTAERDTKLLDEAVKPLESIGAKTYVIAIGKKPDIRELSLAVKKIEDVIQVYSFRDLLAKTQPVTQNMIKETRKYNKNR